MQCPAYSFFLQNNVAKKNINNGIDQTVRKTDGQLIHISMFACWYRPFIYFL